MGKLIYGHIKLSFKHIFRSLLISALIYVVAVILTFVIVGGFELIFVELFGFGFSLWTPKGFFITSAVFGLLGAIFLGAICSLGDGRFSFKGDGYYTFRVYAGSESRESKDKYPRNSVLVLQLFLQLLVCGGAIVWEFLLNYKELFATADASDISMFILMAFPTLLFAQISYLFWGWVGYGAEECPYCKHVFCCHKDSKTTASWDTYNYSETTRRENIGSIGSTQVYADVTRGKIKRTRHTESDVNVNCVVCGQRDSYTSHQSYTG